MKEKINNFVEKIPDIHYTPTRAMLSILLIHLILAYYAYEDFKSEKYSEHIKSILEKENWDWECLTTEDWECLTTKKLFEILNREG